MSSLTLPRIALGCGNFGGIGSAAELFGQGMTDEEALALMDAAWEFGITHFLAPLGRPRSRAVATFHSLYRGLAKPSQRHFDAVTAA